MSGHDYFINHIAQHVLFLRDHRNVFRMFLLKKKQNIISIYLCQHFNVAEHPRITYAMLYHLEMLKISLLAILMGIFGEIKCHQ